MRQIATLAAALLAGSATAVLASPACSVDALNALGVTESTITETAP